MIELAHFIAPNIAPLPLLLLLVASFAGSFITVALGIGGGAMLLAVMASLMPPTALIPVHGVIQFGSNVTRAGLLRAHIHWQPVLSFTLGTVVGVALGGLIVVELPPAVIQISVGLFVAWSVLMRPPAWLSRNGPVIGAISSFLTMFFGATGVFVANFAKSLKLERRAHAATHATFMSIQHVLKVVAFWLLGFAFSGWWPFIAAMIAAGFIGTVIGRTVLIRMSDRAFRLALDAILLLISARLIWTGSTALL